MPLKWVVFAEDRTVKQHWFVILPFLFVFDDVSYILWTLLLLSFDFLLSTLLSGEMRPTDIYI